MEEVTVPPSDRKSLGDYFLFMTLGIPKVRDEKKSEQNQNLLVKAALNWLASSYGRISLCNDDY